MKVNISLELCEFDRKQMGEAIHGKPKLIMRKEVREFVQGSIDSVIQQQIEPSTNAEIVKSSITNNMQGFLRQDHGDPHLRGKSQSYIVGWNRVKFSKGAKS